MNKHIYSIGLPFLLILFLLISIFPMPVYADEAVIGTAVIPVSMMVSGEEGTLSTDIPTETYTVRLSAQGDAPMPREDTLRIEGESSDQFVIDYHRVGVYQYTVSQDDTSLTGENSTCHDRGNYDASVYYVTVTVTNVEGGDFGVAVAVHRNSLTEEKSDLVFHNTYDPVPYKVLVVNKVWTDHGQTRPDAIKVQLIDGDEVVDTVELTKDGWTHTWDRIDPYVSHSFKVQEVAVDGYTPSYSVSGNIVTIHNVGEKKSILQTLTSKSPRTGDENHTLLWITLLLLSIALVIAAGISKKRRMKER